ncbi:MAG: integrase core domain-containing protein, partial [Candidatus Thiodiazotropha endolucinida]|nr:integrase core domain-containing protein [Candidatus Thiodiazotropha taylori]MCW4237957.1 integrase core domain-containing protein [Candidatus Thiodiazotropha endolucinida]
QRPQGLEWDGDWDTWWDIQLEAVKALGMAGPKINSLLGRVFERLKEIRGLPDLLRVDNGPEFLSGILVEWCQANGVFIDYIEPGKPNQNAFIERFNRSLRNELLDLYLFRSLEQVRQLVAEWRSQYNEHRPHDSLGGLPPSVYATENRKNSSLELST